VCTDTEAANCPIGLLTTYDDGLVAGLTMTSLLLDIKTSQREQRDRPALARINIIHVPRRQAR